MIVPLCLWRGRSCSACAQGPEAFNPCLLRQRSGDARHLDQQGLSSPAKTQILLLRTGARDIHRRCRTCTDSTCMHRGAVHARLHGLCACVLRALRTQDCTLVSTRLDTHQCQA